MSIHDPVLGIRGADVNLNAVQEVVIQSGGFNAEYGQAMSGIVNLVTKEGGDRISGELRYRSDAFLPEDYDQGLHLVEADLGGPIPGLRQLKYFFSGAAELRDQFIAARYPRREGSELVTDEPGAMRNTDREYYSGQGKLTYDISPTMKFKVGGFITRTQRGLYGEHAGLPGTGQWDENGSKYKPLDQMLSLMDKSYQVHGIWSHTINKSTFYTLNVAYFKSHRIRGIRDQDEEEGRGFWEDYTFIPWWKYNIIEARTPSQRDTLWNQHDFYGEEYPWGVSGSTLWGFAFGHMGIWQERLNEAVESRLDVTSQISNVHQIKVGASFKNNLKIKYDVGQYIYTRPDTADTILENNLYYDTYEVQPLEGSFYVQDKMEFEDLIVNAGVRFDYFDAVNEMFKYPTGVDPVTGDTTNERVEPDPKYKVSPRLGVSFPVSERTALHMSYGRFFQMPQFRRLYSNIDRPVRKLRGGWPIIGNPDLDAQSTTEYEIGLAHQIGENTSVGVTGYYKDMFDVLSTRLHPHP
ncbi:MAG: TonB-dependent receptor plug domain-containing protein, partial [bacterium]